MIEVSIEKKLGNALKFIYENERVLGNMIKTMARDVLELAQQNLDKNGSWVTGKLSQAGSYEYNPQEYDAIVAFKAPYAAAVEFGTDPHFAPLGPDVKYKKLRSGAIQLMGTPSMITNPLDYYAVRKFGAREIAHCKWGKKYYGVHTVLGFGIWKAIGLKGTDPHPYFRPAIEEVESKQQEYIDRFSVKL